MTINTTVRSAGPFTGNGSASVFTFAFRVFNSSELKVVRTNTATLAKATLVMGSEYTVTLNADQTANPGGSVTLIAGALPVGYTLLITSNVPYLQPIDLTNQGGFYPDVINSGFDRATMQIQQLDQRLTEVGTGPEYWAGVAENFAEDAANYAALAAASADEAASFAGFRDFDSVASLLANTSLTYSGASSNTVQVGQIIRTRNEGFSYSVVASTSSSFHVMTAGGAAGGVKLNVLRGANGWNVLAFNADSTGVTDATEALQKILNTMLASRTGPSGPWGNSLRGLDRVYFPKGKYRMNSGITAESFLSGVEFFGDGPLASSIEYYSDAGSLLSATNFGRVVFRNLVISHIPQNSDRTTWTNNLFSASGTGGGRMLRFENAAVYGFNRVVNNTGTVNFDTFSALYTDFQDANCVYYGRNTQAMINSFYHCSFGGYGDIMQIAGVGHTLFDTCNIVIDGAWLRIFGQSGFGGPTAQYSFVNCKGEFANRSGYSGGARTAVLALDGNKSTISCQVKLINCGLLQGVGIPDSAYAAIELTPNMLVEWQGGALDSRTSILLTPAQVTNIGLRKGSHAGLFLDGLRQVPEPSSIIRGSATSLQTYAQVVYERCVNVPNICLGNIYGDHASMPLVLDRAIQRNCLGLSTQASSGLSAGGLNSPLTFELEAFGSPQAIEEIAVCISKKFEAANLTVEVSLDNFSTTLETITISGASGSANLPVAKAVVSAGSGGPLGKVFTDKLYVRCKGGEAYGYIQVTTRAV